LQPIDIIAHSMGGLDARMLASIRPEIDLDSSTSVPVRTVVTIGTPHRGSPIADLVALRGVANGPFGGLLGIGEKPVIDALAQLHISLDGLRDLTTDQARTFNGTYHDHPAVRYRSFAGRGRGIPFPVAAAFAPLHAYILVTTGEQNDALVTVSSATWTGFDTLLWPADHADEVGHNLDRPFEAPPEWLLKKYEDIAASL
jgi:triacylglycerol lipase